MRKLRPGQTKRQRRRSKTPTRQARPTASRRRVVARKIALVIDKIKGRRSAALKRKQRSKRIGQVTNEILNIVGLRRRSLRDSCNVLHGLHLSVALNSTFLVMSAVIAIPRRCVKSLSETSAPVKSLVRACAPPEPPPSNTLPDPARRVTQNTTAKRATPKTCLNLHIPETAP